VLDSRVIRPGLIVFGLLSCLFCAEASDTNSRPASLDEIQTLFKLAAIGPGQLRVVADITSSDIKWSGEQVAKAIAEQNEMFPNMKGMPQKRQQERTNAVARSHTGTRILHVQEWYSGNLYRLDQTDEGMVSPEFLKQHPGLYKNSFVDIDDPAISPYRSFRVDHVLGDAQLSKVTLYAKNNLWRAKGLDQEVIVPLLVPLVDSQSWPKDRGGTDADMGMLKLDPAKAELLQKGTNPRWHLEANTDSGQRDQTRFVLRGKCMSTIKPYMESDMELVYVIGWAGQSPVCLETSLTNFTTQVSFHSKRDEFDSQGFPHVWKRTTMTPGSPAEQIDVVFKEVDFNPVFNEGKVFKPEFPTNYIVTDVTSGKATVLHKPLRAIKRSEPMKDEYSFKRAMLLIVLVLLPLLQYLAWLMHKRKKPAAKI
jgi:hypothetical protein